MCLCAKCQVPQYFTSSKVVKRHESLIIDFLKEQSSEQVTLKLSANSELAGVVVVMSHVALMNDISSG